MTPTSYLELLGIFSSLIGRKKNELDTSRKRLKTGLDKVSLELIRSTVTYKSVVRTMKNCRELVLQSFIYRKNKQTNTQTQTSK